MSRFPVVFVSHGAPDALLMAPETVASWREIAQEIGVPKAVLVISAHWEARVPTASLSGAPQTIHDFSGFPAALYRMQYPAPGAPDLAQRVVNLLDAAELPIELHPDRGLDHGAWVPLSVMYPQADIPVTQLSLARNADAASHYALGRALTPLRDEGVLILASGAVTHNFDWLQWQPDPQPPAHQKAQAFADWVKVALLQHDTTALLGYRSSALGKEAHPTPEHIHPLFVAAGAADDDIPGAYRPPFTYGGLAMDAYVWRPENETIGTHTGASTT